MSRQVHFGEEKFAVVFDRFQRHSDGNRPLPQMIVIRTAHGVDLRQPKQFCHRVMPGVERMPGRSRQVVQEVTVEYAVQQFPAGRLFDGPPEIGDQPDGVIAEKPVIIAVIA
ncbi:hypothetical protein SDC9_201319 [bioreactor metagenome]|uniref:Uncharacterized protein n=1 Tax=bioreactor metagenome TaxID=1076179 RepID=A0A645IQK7_9ZZZZ